jgi:hypothetical protein
MLTEKAMRSLKAFVIGTIVFARLKINGAYQQFSIHGKRIDGDTVKIDVLIDSARFPGAITVSEIQLYDYEGELWLKKPVDLAKDGVSEGIFCRIALTFTEKMEE